MQTATIRFKTHYLCPGQWFVVVIYIDTGLTRTYCVKQWGVNARPCVADYIMTVWIWAGNYISFTIAADLIRLHMPGVKKSHV